MTLWPIAQILGMCAFPYLIWGTITARRAWRQFIDQMELAGGVRRP